MAVQRDNPYPGFNFVVTISGYEPVPFQEVTGLGVDVGIIEYRNGSDVRSAVRKMPGLKSYPNIVLKRGIVGDLSLWEWLHENGDGGVDRRDVTIALLDESRQEVLRWKVVDAWPSKWQGPSLDAQTNEVALEVLELAHEKLELE